MFYRDPSRRAMPYLQQIPSQMLQYYQPYITAGRQSLATLMGQYGNLLSDPGALMARLGAGYTASPEYKFQLGEMTRAANQAAAAGGMVGSPAEQAELAKTTQGLAASDYQNYINRVLGLYGMGLSGEQGISQMGYGASGQMAQSLKDVLESQAGLAYAGGAGRNLMWENILKGLGGAAGGWIG